MDYSQIKPGHTLSEITQYVVKDVFPDKLVVRSMKANADIELSKAYVEDFLMSANHYDKVEKLPKTKIREIFAEIPAGVVFTVKFNKIPKLPTKTSLTKKLDTAKRGKQSIYNAAKEIIDDLYQAAEGKERTLIGYKVNNEINTNGIYQVVDMQVTTGFNQRSILGNNIVELLYNNTLYQIK